MERLLHQIGSIENRISALTGLQTVLDLNQIVELLQLKLSCQPQHATSARSLSSHFNWRVLRHEILEVAERLSFDVQTLYQCGFQFISGNSILSPGNYELVFIDLRITINRFETSLLLGALWIGNQSWNANGLLLAAVLDCVRKIKEVLVVLQPAHHEEETRFQKKLAFLKNKVLGIILPDRDWEQDPHKLKKARMLQEAGCRFVGVMNNLLGILESIDEQLLHVPQFKTASEIAMIMHLFESFNNVRFDKRGLEEAYRYIPGSTVNYIDVVNSMYTGNYSHLGYPSKPFASRIYESEATLGRRSTSAEEGQFRSRQSVRVSTNRETPRQNLDFDSGDGNIAYSQSLPDAYNILAEHLTSLQDLNARSKKSVYNNKD